MRKKLKHATLEETCENEDKDNTQTLITDFNQINIFFYIVKFQVYILISGVFQVCNRI
jgi:hypothetical protein